MEKNLGDDDGMVANLNDNLLMHSGNHKYNVIIIKVGNHCFSQFTLSIYSTVNKSSDNHYSFKL